MRCIVPLLLILLSGNVFAGEQLERYFKIRKEIEKTPIIEKPASPDDIIGVSLLRLPDLAVNGGPEYRIDIDSQGNVRYQGFAEVETIGKLQGTTLKGDFSRIAKHLWESVYFELPKFRYPSYSDNRESILYIKTKQGEKWVVDPHDLGDLHPTIEAIGGMIDQTLLNSSLHISVPKARGAAYGLGHNIFEPLKIVCFGDSVTGVYYHTGGRRAYTDMVEIGLDPIYPKSKVTAINAGISGNTTVNALARIQKDVLDHKPDLVTIMFGLNDMTRVSLEDYRANLKSIILQCRLAGSEVMLCTPNSVRDTTGRPTAKLEEYVSVVRELATELNILFADCYGAFESVRNEDPLDWAFLMSDEIHPNMGGHKLIAETILSRIHKPISLAGAPAPQPTIPRTLKLIADKKPINILAMTPYDTMIAEVLKDVAPESTATVTPWDVDKKMLAEIEAASKVNVRGKGYDLVLLAVPAEASTDTPEAFIQSYSWILNFSLSFGYQEWDVVALPPSLLAKHGGENATRSACANRLIAAQDFELLDSSQGSPAEAKRVLHEWLQQQITSSTQ